MMTALTTESVMRHLGHDDPARARDAETELIRRGVPNRDIELAKRFAAATADDRVRLIDMAVRSADHEPLPWLRWMTDDSQRRVRLHAVSILATMQTPEAKEILRSRLPRESDPHVATRIRRALDLR